MKSVTVKRLDLKWMVEDPMKFLKLMTILNFANYDQIYVTEFVKQVLD